MQNDKVVVVMPAYNAGRTLRMTYEELPRDTVSLVILVDDGSTDGTLEVARQLGLEIFVHNRNYGYGANQKTCYAEALRAGAEIVVMVHPDYQYDPRLVPQIIEPIVSGRADVVLGSRLKEGSALAQGMPWWKYFANGFLTGLENRACRDARGPPPRGGRGGCRSAPGGGDRAGRVDRRRSLVHPRRRVRHRPRRGRGAPRAGGSAPVAQGVARVDGDPGRRRVRPRDGVHRGHPAPGAEDPRPRPRLLRAGRLEYRHRLWSVRDVPADERLGRSLLARALSHGTARPRRAGGDRIARRADARAGGGRPGGVRIRGAPAQRGAGRRRARASLPGQSVAPRDQHPRHPSPSVRDHLDRCRRARAR